VTRVCSYDRAGLGWSERGDGPFDPARVPDELRALLTGAREPAPYVVAGQGLGAAFAAAFGSRFPDITAGVVLFDAPSSGSASLDHNSLGGMPRAMPWLARVGLLRIVNAGTRNVDPVSRAFMNRPDHLTRAALELAKWDDAVRLIPEAAAGSPAPPARGLTTTAALPAPPQSEEGATAATTAIRQALQKARRR
jgi:pimeloyl-ACP methyl ester carboxylesterase